MELGSLLDPLYKINDSTFHQDEDIEDLIKGDYRHASTSVPTQSFSSSRHSGATVVGITYRLPDVRVYPSAQEGPMKITRSPRRRDNPKAHKSGC